MKHVRRAGRPGSLAPWAAGALLLHGLAWVVVRESVMSRSVTVPPAHDVPQVSLVVIEKGPEPARPSPRPAPVSAPPRALPPTRPLAPRPRSHPKPPAEADSAPAVPPVVDAPADVDGASRASRSPAQSGDVVAARQDPAPDATSSADARATIGEDESELARYVALVRMRIDARKVYPAIARRRGVEGRVVARIRIDEAGRVLSLDTASGSSAVLGRSARDAIQAAAPFPPPPDGEFELEIALRYSLDAS